MDTFRLIGIIHIIASASLLVFLGLRMFDDNLYEGITASENNVSATIHRLRPLLNEDGSHAVQTLPIRLHYVDYSITNISMQDCLQMASDFRHDWTDPVSDYIVECKIQ